MKLYDAFEKIAEQLLGNAPSLMVSWNESGLRMAAETDMPPDMERIALPVRAFESDGILYVEVRAEEEGRS